MGACEAFATPLCVACSGDLIQEPSGCCVVPGSVLAAQVGVCRGREGEFEEVCSGWWRSEAGELPCGVPVCLGALLEQVQP